MWHKMKTIDKRKSKQISNGKNCTNRLLHVCNAYRPPSSARNSSVNRVSSPHGIFASTWISSCDSDKCAKRLRPTERKFTWNYRFFVVVVIIVKFFASVFYTIYFFNRFVLACFIFYSTLFFHYYFCSAFFY